MTDSDKVRDKVSIKKFNQFASFYLNPSTADVFFIVGDLNCTKPERLPAHKVVLASCSPVFQTMFYGSLPENGDVRITDATADGFKEFMQYFYFDEAKLTLENVSEVIYLAKKYEVDAYLAACSVFLQQKLKIDQVCTGLELASKFEMHDLETFCKARVRLLNVKFFESKAFVQCSVDVLKMILQWDELKLYSHEIFVGCFRWARNAWKQQHGIQKEPLMSDVRDQLNDYFALIEFSSIKCQVIVSILAEFTEFFTKSDLIMIHKILAIKYPVKLDDCTELKCPLRAVDNIPVQEYYLKEVETITFQSSRKLFFVGYDWSPELLNTELGFAHINASLIKKSSNPNVGDIVLERRSFFLCDEDECYITTDTIAIEPNTKYELRLKFEFSCMMTDHTESIFTSNICEFKNNETVSAEGESNIANLLFKY